MALLTQKMEKGKPCCYVRKIARVEGKPPLGRYFLHSHRIRFRLPSSGEEMVVVSPLPRELEEWMAPAG